MIKVKRGKVARVCQGDIYEDVEYVESLSEKSGIIEISKVIFPIVIVLTQDCDLQWDYHQRWSLEKSGDNQDKWLLSALVAPMYNIEHVYRGEHLSELKMAMQKISRNKTPGKYLVQNKMLRYHYIEFPDDIDIVDSVIDFKHYFSVNIEYLKKIKKTNYVCRISELFREDISQRFANFLSRIGLP